MTHSTRFAAILLAAGVALIVPACSGGGDDAAPSPVTGTSQTTVTVPAGNTRGAVESAIGEPVQRADGSYTLTATSFTDPGLCDTYGVDRSPADTGDRLILARFTFQTGSTPLSGSYLNPMDFYSVTGDVVEATPNIGGEYDCEGDAEGRTETNRPLPNSTVSVSESFLIPTAAQFLGYRDPETGEAFEWTLTDIAPAAPVEPTPVYVPPAVEPDLPAPVDEGPLESSCSDAQWRESMGSEGDALCGSTWTGYAVTPAAFLYCDGTVGIYEAGGYEYDDPNCASGSDGSQTYTDEQGTWIYICTGPNDPRPAAECTVPAN